MFKRRSLLKQFSNNPNLGCLALRVLVFLRLFMKLFTFGQMAQDFPNPPNIGSVPTLAIAGNKHSRL